jgi:hypothetical protein
MVKSLKLATLEIVDLGWIKKFITNKFKDINLENLPKKNNWKSKEWRSNLIRKTTKEGEIIKTKINWKINFKQNKRQSKEWVPNFKDENKLKGDEISKAYQFYKLFKIKKIIIIGKEIKFEYSTN